MAFGRRWKKAESGHHASETEARLRFRLGVNVVYTLYSRGDKEKQHKICHSADKAKGHATLAFFAMPPRFAP